jgi:hypothetical protein
MKKFVATALIAIVGLSGSLLAFEPAAALTPADVVPNSATTVTADCHGGQTGFVYSSYALFVDDTFTLSLTNCNAHYAKPDTWNYGNVYTKVNYGNGGTGVRNPNTYAFGNDQQCLQQSLTNDFTSAPYSYTGITATMTDSITNNSDVDANKLPYIFVYDHDAGLPNCTSGQFWRWKQLAYSLYPVTPTVTADFSDDAVAVDADSTLTITLTNTQRYRTGVRGSFTNLGLDVALPTGANLDTAAAAGTCGGTVTATTPSGVNTLHYTGGALADTLDSCTITVPVAFSTAGAKTLSAASLTASTSNKSELINDLSATITVNADQYITPAQQSPVLEDGIEMTPTDAFVPTGFTGTVTYSISPTIPDGLSFDTTTGIVSGTPTTPSASADYTVTATDGTYTATAIITMGVASRPAGIYPASQTTQARVGEAITPTETLDLLSVPCPAELTISPALPDGLSFDDVTGVISGTPTGVSAEADYEISADCGEGGRYTSTVTLSVGAGGPDIAGLVNTGLALLGPAGVIGLLLAIGAPFFFVSERFRQVRAAGAVVLHKSAHLTVTSPARFFDRLRGKK